MENPIKFDVALKMILQEGTLAWEYNPFRNYRLDKDMIFYKNKFYLIDDFRKEYKISENITYKNGAFYKGENEVTNWFDLGFPNTEEVPVPYQKGQLVDFITGELHFDLNHPVQITPQYSYDNSVDLIINDGISKPKIINSRFSAIGKNKYKIIDRNGTNDTNIYDKGDGFYIDTSLYKVTNNIPSIKFGGLSSGGNLKIGNYHFYFKYSDLDGNESDFVGLSGLVSVFIGNNPNSINTGFRGQNSNKQVRFILSNIDKDYDYILVYYSRATSEEFQNRVTLYHKIMQKYKISEGSTTIVDITGFENTLEVSEIEINERLQIYDSAKTLAVALNMLFLGNVTSSNEDHDLLSRLALYIIPSVDTNKTCGINGLNLNYKGDITNTYYNPDFIYKYTGYWDDEIYRFGVVFIKKNNTLTPVYNVRGLHLGSGTTNVEYGDNKLVTYNEATFEIDDTFKISTENKTLENAKGVCYIPFLDELNKVIGINFKIEKEVVDKLDKLNIKGYFIVRQKRIPTTLCLAYTIGVEAESHTPMIPIPIKNELKFIYESFLNEKEEYYAYFKDGKVKRDKGNLLTHSYDNHKRTIDKGFITSTAAICPDYDVNTPYLNQLFTGSDFIVITRAKEKYPTNYGRLYDIANLESKDKDNYNEVKIIGVEDNTPLVGIGDDLFSALAGLPTEAYRYAYVGAKVKKERGGNNLIRGSFGNYLGITNYNKYGNLITIKIPGYNISNMLDYFKIRYHNASMFYPISDRLLFNDAEEDTKYRNLGTFYRGDCYICKFTHRLNRNFRDNDTPTNDEIIDPACWTKNMRFEDDVLKTDDLDKINRGDVNAVNLGQWITFTLRSNINHSVRSLNETDVDELALIGNCRGFYPYHPLSARAGYKLPEAGTYNKGFEASVGEQVFEELPIVPYYRDIYSTRIAYSNIQITSAFKNAYRVFKSGHHRDYPITYGEITKIIEWNGDIICVLEHGIYKIPVNERALAGQGSGGNIYVNTSNVLPENPIVISDTFGSLWIDSIIKTPTGIYGVDTVAKKIWKVDGNGIELISDFKVQEFLNNNITFGERELTPIIGIRNVKTHYNAFKRDVMFTFYDDLNGISECVWNLCWNEPMAKWITFYSWVPSFSENIYNTYFSFDRETSKLIAKLMIDGKSDNASYLMYIDHSTMSDKADIPILNEKGELETDENGQLRYEPENYIGLLHYDLGEKTHDTEISCEWKLVKDPWNNYKYFDLDENTGRLSYKDNYSKFVVEFPNSVEYNLTTYTVGEDGNWLGNPPVSITTELNKIRLRKWKELFNSDDNGSDISLSKDLFKPQKVYTLNVRVTPTVTYNGFDASRAEYIANKNANSRLTGGYVERSISVIPKEHLEALSTDFWRHGLSGIFDITEEIKPTYWYGKQHPFEFEFIVRDLPDTHKIFDNLIIISNKAAPESFHYEIVGECYEFAKDKKNMYIRQEATKELFLNSGYNIEYNSNYRELKSIHRPINKTRVFDKSTIFPAYYRRLDKLNTIEDYYHKRPGEEGKDFSKLTGSEIVYYKKLNEFRIWEHQEGIDINQEGGRLRGNMNYTEDKWYVLIPPIKLTQCNEPDWSDVKFGKEDSTKVPIELLQANFINAGSIDTTVSPLDERGIVFWEEYKVRHSEIKPKDKYIKIRIRYSGKDLAVISAIKTLYSISYA